MFKDYARIWLEVVSVRAERLQEIDFSGCVAEGIDPRKYAIIGWDESDEPDQEAIRAALASKWDSLNAKRGYPWSANDWVFAVEFSVA